MNENALSDLDDLTDLSYLSNAISYETDIAPHQIIEIFAGVGSGKNKFINRFTKGDPKRNIPRMTTLVITSRKSKVSELLSDEEASYADYIGENGNLDLLDEDDVEHFFEYCRTIPGEWGGSLRFQKSVACTNAFIEKYIRYKYQPNVPSTHLWNLFDLIVVDEFHALVMDASYQTAPYYVNSFIWEFAYRHYHADQHSDCPGIRPLCKHLILMTGTPTTVRKLPIPYVTPHVMDMMNICRNVVPKNVWFVDKKCAKELIEQKIVSQKRCIYFTNHIQFPEEFCEGTSISPAVVAVSFSKKEQRELLAQAYSTPEEERTEDQEKMAQLYGDIIELEDSIAQKSMIPQRFLLWLTTSRNKEGINIIDDDIDDVFVESHCISDIKQMAGRVRHGAENLYIVVDSQGYSQMGFKDEAWITKEDYAPDVRDMKPGETLSKWVLNQSLEKLCIKNDISNFYAERYSDFCPYQGSKNSICDYIDFVEDRFSFAHFDFFRNHFCYYYLREVAIRYNDSQARRFQEAQNDYSKYVEMFKKVFPTATIHPYKDRLEQMRDFLEQQLDGNPVREFSDDEMTQQIDKLNRILFADPADYLESRNSLLKKIGLKAVRASNSPNKPGYKRWHYRQVDPEQLAC